MAIAILATLKISWLIDWLIPIRFQSTEPISNLAEMLFEAERIDWRSRIFDFTSHCQEGGHDVISRRSAATWWVHTQRLPGACSAASASSQSVVHCYLFFSYRVVIYRTNRLCDCVVAQEDDEYDCSTFWDYCLENQNQPRASLLTPLIRSIVVFVVKAFFCILAVDITSRRWFYISYL